MRGALAALLLAWTAPALAAEPPSAPILRLEPGTHTAMINRAALVPGGTLVTASDDKTARLWRVADGMPMGVLRPPIGDEDEGALYAVAASSRNIAVGGRTCGSWEAAFCVYLFTADGARMLGKLGNLKAPVTALAFSADGRYLAVGQQGNGGLRVLDLDAKGIAFETGAGDTVSWLDYAADGRLAAVSADGSVQVFEAGGRVLGSARVTKPWSTAFSPNGRLLAVGGAAGVTVLDAGTLGRVAELTGDAGKAGPLSLAAWSPDGATLYGAGGYGDGRAWHVRSWAVPGFAVLGDVPAAIRTITALVPLPERKVAVTSTAPGWAVIDASGRPLAGQVPRTAQFPKGRGDTLRLSADGQAVEFPLDADGGQRVRFDLQRRTLADAGGRGPAVSAPRGARAEAIGTLDRNEGIASADGDGEVTVLGTDFYLRAYKGRFPAWKTVLPAAARAVALTADKAKVVAALGDGTIRWYRRDSGAEVLALFVHAGDRRWIAWTPQGYFDHAPLSETAATGASLIGYHVNRARNREGEFVAVEQLYTGFARRDLVVQSFAGGKGGESGIGQVVTAAALPPKVDGVELCGGGGQGCRAVTRSGPGAAASVMSVADGKAQVQARLLDRGAGIGKARITRNGVVVNTAATTVSDTKAERVERYAVDLEPGDNRIVVSAFDRQGAVEAKAEDRVEVVVRFEPPKTLPAQGRPTLYVLAVGVSEYKLKPFVLDNAAIDARAVTQAISTSKLDTYEKVVAVSLIDGQATRESITAELRTLGDRARPEDAFVLFMAGHGQSVGGRYFFAPVEFGTHSAPPPKGASAAEQQKVVDRMFAEDGLSQETLSDLLARIRAGKGIVLLDTCYSASLRVKDADVTTGTQLNYALGRPILAAAVGQAIDGSESVKHGYFTRFLLEGLQGRADQNGNGRVDVMELASFVMEEVEKAAKDEYDFEQQPTLTGTAIRRFDIATVKGAK
ncbi:MAG: caspase family protein [Magnetospirillum sp.]|nr:caspase family protein [Magnetospirillum sp.]